MNYNFDWNVVANAFPAMMQGLGLTLQITVITIVISMILAVPLAVGRMSKIEVIRWAAQGYIEIFRCTPLLVQLFWIFYALPALTGVTLPGYASAVIALTANLTAFMAETYRSGFQSVPVEQVEAGRMLQLSRFQQLRYIIVPQALRQQLPVILSLNISLFKDTALVSTIAVSDLMFISNTISSQTYRALEVFTLAAGVYFAIAFPISLITSSIERRMQNSSGMGAPAPRRLASRMMPGTRPVVPA
ncbi:MULTISPECIES: amino acid ABC transporter permease [Micrococcaceae]|jgi:His/Glu/Gln/Arg/opine family amino acid ABC transporter permease subunit|uniref:amino acid ABC transporter permease n=1 Tax=Micrococcaceae TaxID=1268 RepID=UPI0011542D95|nr:amino acid ABC transporter permease [Arthrobacter sp. SLBN-122]TQJ34188.1 polar amino acid transport system permease protein [Arthrobacter sp. SLBN-122]